MEYLSLHESPSHTMLPHPQGQNPLSSSAHSLGRQSAMVEQERLRKFSQESPGKGMLRNSGRVKSRLWMFLEILLPRINFLKICESA